MVNAGNKFEDMEHFNKIKAEEFKDKDLSIELLEDRALVAIQGPQAAAQVQSFFDFDLTKVGFMESHLLPMKRLGEEVLVSRCGYTGEDGFEISVSNANATKFVDLIMESGVVIPAGLGARNSLRLEAGLCLHGNDMDESINPLEAQLKWVLGKRRREEGGFVGFDAVKTQMEGKLKKKRIGFVIESNKPAREGVELFRDGKKVGEVCSGSPSPTLKKSIGMAYVKPLSGKVGRVLQASIRGKMVDVTVTKMPFTPANYYRKE